MILRQVRNVKVGDRISFHSNIYEVSAIDNSPDDQKATLTLNPDGFRSMRTLQLHRDDLNEIAPTYQEI